MDSLYQILKHAHSGLRWVVLVALILAISNAFSKRKAGTYAAGDHKLAFWGMMSVHIQLLLGLALYFLSPMVSFESGFMGNSILRFYTIEHLVGMILGIVLITIGYSKAKRQAGHGKKFSIILTMYTIGLLVILASIPWPFRIPGAGWF